MKFLEIDGRTGEGGGQLVRVAVGLAALTTQAIRIVNVRGNRTAGNSRGGGSKGQNATAIRSDARGGGLKSQHVTAIQWLAEVTEADVTGLEVGSKTLTFAPKRSPGKLLRRKIKIKAESGAASTLLIFQGILPFLLFAGDDKDTSITVEISGGTNVSYSLSFEYLNLILLPTLEERFGIMVERKMVQRGWSLGSHSRGAIVVKIHPVPLGKTFTYKPLCASSRSDLLQVMSVDVSMALPGADHEAMQRTLANDLAVLFPEAEVNFQNTEQSTQDSRWYVILVAKSRAGTRWGCDILTSLPKRVDSREGFVAQVSRKLCKDLHQEIQQGGQVDKFLQDQLVCFQALCDGFSSFPRLGEEDHEDLSATELSEQLQGLQLEDTEKKRDRTKAPFGHGSMHTKTARWIVAEMLPQVEFYNQGNIVKGIAFSVN